MKVEEFQAQMGGPTLYRIAKWFSVHHSTISSWAHRKNGGIPERHLEKAQELIEAYKKDPRPFGDQRGPVNSGKTIPEPGSKSPYARYISPPLQAPTVPLQNTNPVPASPVKKEMQVHELPKEKKVEEGPVVALVGKPGDVLKVLSELKLG